MEHVTYYLGAGASYHSLPIVEEMATNLQYIIAYLESNFKKEEIEIETFIVNGHIEVNISELKDLLIEDLKWLYTESSEHNSIDAFAKTLLINQNQKSLNRLKNALSAWFSIAERLNGFDKRYSQFFTEILNSRDIPKNLKIVSWNYDLEIEYAISNIFGIDDYSDVSSILPTAIKHTKKLTNEMLFKVNGNITLMDIYTKATAPYSINLKKNLDLETFLNILKHYYLIKFKPPYFKGITTLSFAWEDEIKKNEDHSILERTQHGIYETSILVVIGYSFPPTNRKIDGKILNGLVNLRKIYVQSKDFEGVKNELLNILSKSVEVIQIRNLDQFYIPHEFQY